MKKAYAILLLFAMLLSTACGEQSNVNDNTDGEMSTSTNEESSAGTGRDAIKSSLPEDLKFEGKTVNILCGDSEEKLLEVYAEQTGEVVDDAIYNRNLAVSERLGITIEHTPIEDYQGTTITKTIKENVLAGDEPYSLAFAAQYYSTSAALEGVYYNLLDMKYIDTSREYYSQGFIEAATIFDTLFYITGDASLSQTTSSYVTFFNKKQANTWLPDTDLYQMVYDGTWTWNNLGTLMKDIYDDLNGNGERDIDDFYGMCTTYTTSPLDSILPSCNIKIAQVDSSGNISLTLNNERTVNMYEMLDNFLNKNDGVFCEGETGDAQTAALEQFIASKSIFQITQLNKSASSLRDFQDPYGILPVPKYDEEQENYYTIPHDQYSIIVVPSNCSDPDLVGAVIEELNYQSYKTVTPAYFEVALKSKYLDGEEDADMYDILVAGKCFDPAVIYSNYCGNLSWISRLIFRQKQSFATYYASIETSTIAKLEELTDTLKELSDELHS